MTKGKFYSNLLAGLTWFGWMWWLIGIERLLAIKYPHEVAWAALPLPFCGLAFGITKPQPKTARYWIGLLSLTAIFIAGSYVVTVNTNASGLDLARMLVVAGFLIATGVLFGSSTSLSKFSLVGAILGLTFVPLALYSRAPQYTAAIGAGLVAFEAVRIRPKLPNWAALVASLTILLWVISSNQWSQLDAPSNTKPLANIPNQRISAVVYSPEARFDIFERPQLDANREKLYGIPKYLVFDFPPREWITQDGEGSGFALRTETTSLAALTWHPFSLALHLLRYNPHSIVVLNPGGGVAVEVARFMGADRIVAIEPYPELTEALARLGIQYNKTSGVDTLFARYATALGKLDKPVDALLFDCGISGQNSLFVAPQPCCIKAAKLLAHSARLIPESGMIALLCPNQEEAGTAIEILQNSDEFKTVLGAQNQEAALIVALKSVQGDAATYFKESVSILGMRALSPSNRPASVLNWALLFAFIVSVLGTIVVVGIVEKTRQNIPNVLRLILISTALGLVLYWSVQYASELIPGYAAAALAGVAILVGIYFKRSLSVWAIVAIAFITLGVGTAVAFTTPSFWTVRYGMLTGVALGATVEIWLILVSLVVAQASNAKVLDSATTGLAVSGAVMGYFAAPILGITAGAACALLLLSGLFIKRMTD